MNIKEQKVLLRTKKKKDYRITMDSFLNYVFKLAIRCETEREAKILFKVYKKAGINLEEKEYNNKLPCYLNQLKKYFSGCSETFCNCFSVKIFDFNEVDMSKYLKEDELEL